MPSGSWLSGFHQLIVQPRLVDDLTRMPNQFPDPAEDHCLLCVVLSDLLALLTQFLSHGCHPCSPWLPPCSGGRSPSSPDRAPS